MISLYKTSANDLGSSIVLRNVLDFGEYASTARISRKKTLDGGGVITSFGHSVKDMERTVECLVTRDVADVLETLHENTVELRIGLPGKNYNGYIYRLNIDGRGVARINFIFTEENG